MFQKSDLEILRPLLIWQRDIGHTPEMAYRRELWRRTNDLEKGERPPILIYPEGSWREIDEVIPLSCSGEQARFLERKLRRMKFAYENFGDDMVINPYCEVPYQVTFSDYGVNVIRHQTDSQGAWKAEPPLKDLQKDLSRLHYRSLCYDRAGTRQLFDAYRESFGDLLPIVPFAEYFWSVGLTSEVIDLFGMEEFMLAMYDDPDGVHALMRFLMEDKLKMLDELEQLELVTCNSECWHIGSGGLGFTKTLPGITKPPARPVTFKDTWGLIESQETVGVSPDMFAEFIWPYQKQLAERFGRLYYGCCEPVETRFDFIREAPNLRAISVSPWSDVAKCSELYQNNYTMFCKPNPGRIAVDFVEEAVKADLRNIVEHIRENSAAIILKDLHTVSHDLSRYGRWSRLAREAISDSY